MPARLFLFLTIAVPVLLADPHPKPSDYPAHIESARLDIGAEYMVHTFSNGRQSFLTPDYLVVDTAIYPHGPLVINAGRFRLVIDGASIAPQSPGIVALSLAGSMFNADQQSPQRAPFPGGAPGGGYPPPVTQAPDPSRPDAQAGPENADDVLKRTALPEGEFHSPQGGFLYFAYRGKLKKIKSMKLIYADERGDLAIPLIP